MSVPTSPRAWLVEIADAFVDAAEAMPFGPLVDLDIEPADLFHLGPAVCLKLRGITATRARLKKATEAALTSYIVMQEREPEAMVTPHVAFAFCYLAAHFGLDLMNEQDVGAIMDYVVEHERQLVRLILQRAQP
jgi:hypothetical protein